MGALLTAGVRNPNHQVSIATAAMTRMPPAQKIGLRPLADGEIGWGSGSAGKSPAMGVTGTDSAARGGGAGATELGTADLLMIWLARAGAADASDKVDAAADCAISTRGAAPVGW